MEFKIKDKYGILIWGTKQGQKGFVWSNILEDGGVEFGGSNAFMNIVSDPQMYFSFSTNFNLGDYAYSFEWEENYAAYTIYRPIYDWRGRNGFYCITIYVAKGYLPPLENVPSILDKLSDLYWKKYIEHSPEHPNPSPKQIRKNVEENITLFTDVLKNYPLVPTYEDYGGSDKKKIIGHILYNSQEKLTETFATLHPIYREQYKRIYIFKKSVAQRINCSKEPIFLPPVIPPKVAVAIILETPKISKSSLENITFSISINGKVEKRRTDKNGEIHFCKEKDKDGRLEVQDVLKIELADSNYEKGAVQESLVKKMSKNSVKKRYEIVFELPNLKVIKSDKNKKVKTELLPNKTSNDKKVEVVFKVEVDGEPIGEGVIFKVKTEKGYRNFLTNKDGVLSFKELRFSITKEVQIELEKQAENDFKKFSQQIQLRKHYEDLIKKSPEADKLSILLHLERSKKTFSKNGGSYSLNFEFVNAKNNKTISPSKLNYEFVKETKVIKDEVVDDKVIVKGNNDLDKVTIIVEASNKWKCFSKEMSINTLRGNTTIELEPQVTKLGGILFGGITFVKKYKKYLVLLLVLVLITYAIVWFFSGDTIKEDITLVEAKTDQSLIDSLKLIQVFCDTATLLSVNQRQQKELKAYLTKNNTRVKGADTTRYNEVKLVIDSLEFKPAVNILKPVVTKKTSQKIKKSIPEKIPQGFRNKIFELKNDPKFEDLETQIVIKDYLKILNQYPNDQDYPFYKIQLNKALEACIHYRRVLAFCKELNAKKVLLKDMSFEQTMQQEFISGYTLTKLRDENKKLRFKDGVLGDENLNPFFNSTQEFELNKIERKVFNLSKKLCLQNK